MGFRNLASLLLAARSLADTFEAHLDCTSVPPLRTKPALEISNDTVECRVLRWMRLGSIGLRIVRDPVGDQQAQFSYPGIACREAFSKLSLLSAQLFLQFRILGFKCAQALNVGPIGGSDEMRKHVHFAEHLPHQIVRRCWMRQCRPVGA